MSLDACLQGGSRLVSWRGVSWLQTGTSQCKRSCENGTFKILLNSSAVEKVSLVFLFFEETCNREDMLGATCSLYHFGRNVIRLDRLIKHQEGNVQSALLCYEQ